MGLKAVKSIGKPPKILACFETTSVFFRDPAQVNFAKK